VFHFPIFVPCDFHTLLLLLSIYCRYRSIVPKLITLHIRDSKLKFYFPPRSSHIRHTEDCFKWKLQIWNSSVARRMVSVCTMHLLYFFGGSVLSSIWASYWTGKERKLNSSATCQGTPAPVSIFNEIRWNVGCQQAFLITGADITMPLKPLV